MIPVDSQSMRPRLIVTDGRLYVPSDPVKRIDLESHQNGTL